jgi:hypothetical protein
VPAIWPPPFPVQHIVIEAPRQHAEIDAQEIAGIVTIIKSHDIETVDGAQLLGVFGGELQHHPQIAADAVVPFGNGRGVTASVIAATKVSKCQGH